MRKIFYVIGLLVPAYFLIIFGLILLTSCKNSIKENNSNEPGSRTEKFEEGELKTFASPNKVNQTKMSTLESTYNADYSPLTRELLLSVLENNQEFSYISILYSKSSNFQQNSRSQDSLQFALDAGQFGSSNLYNSIVNFDGSLSREYQTTSPPVSDYLEKSFTTTKVQEIMNYVLDSENQEYFFYGEEYQGRDTPYKSNSIHLCVGYHAITIAIYEPNQDSHAWAISKCGYEQPNQILQGFINIIENDFISQFE